MQLVLIDIYITRLDAIISNPVKILPFVSFYHVVFSIVAPAPYDSTGRDIFLTFQRSSFPSQMLQLELLFVVVLLEVVLCSFFWSCHHHLLQFETVTL